MTDNSNGRKKVLIVSVLAFLLAGGGVFLFFIVQGSDDLTGAGKKTNFQYGGGAREAVSSFFKVLGFDDVESIAKEGVKERPRLTLLPESAGPMASSSSGGAESDWGTARPAPPRPSVSSPVPKMAARSGSGAGGFGGGSSSAGGAGRFGSGTDAGNTRVSARSQGAGGGTAGKGTLASLKNARAMLGTGLKSGSAMTAKSSWDASFGAGGGSGGGGNDMTYEKSGLVKLDAIKKGEVGNLKTSDAKSLKVPEPGAFKEDKEAEANDANLQKSKKKAEESMSSSLMKSVGSTALDGLFKSGNKGPSAPTDPVSGPSEGATDDAGVNRSGMDDSGIDAGGCDLDAGPPTPLCSAALSSGNTATTDTSVGYKQIGAAGDDKIYEVTYSGTGPGVTGQNKDQPVFYSDTVTVKIDASNNVTILGWKEPVEIPTSNLQ